MGDSDATEAGAIQGAWRVCPDCERRRVPGSPHPDSCSSAISSSFRFVKHENTPGGFLCCGCALKKGWECFPHCACPHCYKRATVPDKTFSAGMTAQLTGLQDPYSPSLNGKFAEVNKLNDDGSYEVVLLYDHDYRTKPLVKLRGAKPFGSREILDIQTVNLLCYQLPPSPHNSATPHL